MDKIVERLRTKKGQTVYVAIPFFISSAFILFITIIGIFQNIWDQGYFDTVIEQWRSDVILEYSVINAGE